MKQHFLLFFLSLILFNLVPIRDAYKRHYPSPSFLLSKQRLLCAPSIPPNGKTNITSRTSSSLSSFSSLGSSLAMEKLLEQAKALRLEADSLVAQESKATASSPAPSISKLSSKLNEFSGMIRDDIVVNKTVYGLLNTTSTSSPTSSLNVNISDVPHESPGPASILVTREGELKRKTKLQEGMSAERTKKEENLSIDAYAGLNATVLEGFLKELIEMDAQSSVSYNVSLLPDTSGVIKKVPLFLRPFVWFTTWAIGGEDVYSQVLNTAVLLFLDEYFTVQDEVDPNSAQIIDRVNTINDDLLKLITINPVKNTTMSLNISEAEVALDDVDSWVTSICLSGGLPEEAVKKLCVGYRSCLMNAYPERTNFEKKELFSLFLLFVDSTLAKLLFKPFSFATTMTNSTAEEEIDGVEMEEMFSGLRDMFASMEEDTELKNTADRVIVEYFEPESRNSGLVISREAAGRLQVELLKDIFVVTGVSTKCGAVIFNGRPLGSSERFIKLIAERYKSSLYKDDFNYFLLQNNVYPTVGSMEEMALESLTSTSTAIVLYPSSWNSVATSSLRSDGKKLWRSFYISAALLSSSVFAASCLPSEGPASDAFLPLAFTPIVLQTAGVLSELIVASTRKFNASVLIVPSLRIGSWGPRVLYTSMPASRNDIFDAAFAGVAVSIITSFGAIIAGLDFTAHTDAASLASLPSLPVSLLRSSTLVRELCQWKFPTEFSGLPADGFFHLHWLAVSGIVGLIGSLYRIFPIDNSAGSKMAFSVLGLEPFFVLNAASLFFRLVFLFPFVFDLGSSGSDFGAKSLLVDFFFSSRFAGSSSVHTPFAQSTPICGLKLNL